MDQDYDVIVCGTGFSECILSGLLSTSGKKVLHVDRNAYYGGESASLNLTNLFAKFEPNTKPPDSWGANRDWNLDLIPKFIMANGKLVKILIKTRVKDYLEFQVVEGCYVYQHQKAGFLSSEKFIHKVPATESEALRSAMIPTMEKFRGAQFFSFISNWDPAKPSTWNGLHPTKTSMAQCYKHFGVSVSTQEFVGHSVALHTSEEYLNRPMGETMDKLKLYLQSLLRYGYSPFIYPMYGLGTLPEGFSRLSAVYGGTYMLDTNPKRFLYDENGRISGVEGEDGQVARCKMLICDPSYVLQMMDVDEPNRKAMAAKVEKRGRIIRVICILNAPIPGTNSKRSCQIILPQNQLQRKTDIYIAMISSTHGVCKEGKYAALVSATIETENPFQEIQPALSLLGPIEKQFVAYSDLYCAIDDGSKDNVYVTDSYDATSHFESATENVLKLWKQMMGEELDLAPAPEPEATE